jgi:hypothetical protein
MNKAKLIGFAVSLIMASQAVSDGSPWWTPSSVQIVPEQPTSSDVVAITLSGDWGSGCIPNASAISVVGNNVYFDVIWDYPPGIICTMAITPWEHTSSVGPLPPGTYIVYARIVGYPHIQSIYVPVAQFIVSDKQFVLSAKSLTVPEGGTASFTVALLKDPCETVEVTVARQSGDPDITIESGGKLFFDYSNYSTPQTVTLAAAEDEDYFHGQAVIQVSASGYLTVDITTAEKDNDVPSVFYVDKDAAGNNNGKSWADAFTDLQNALSVAGQYPEVKEIHVAEGIYRPTDLSGSRYATFHLINGLIIKGGYAGCGEPDPNARSISSHKTILSGDLNGNDVPNFTNRGDNSFNVVVGSGTDSTAALDGFTITAGDGAVGGGGMLCYDGDPTIRNCTFRGNRSNYGGGIRCYNSNLTITNCVFEGNGSLGGTLDDGGAIYIQGSGRPTLTNCTFVNNWTVETGGGLCCNYPSVAKVTNCIFWGNSDSSGASESAQIYCGNLVINYSCVQNWTGILGGSGNFGDNPLFADPNNGNYHLSEISPCINTGDPNYTAEPNETDLDGKPRIIGGRIDMGAYEFNHIPIANAGPDQTVYAWIDGFADVTLDGSASYDDDNQPLSYKWIWRGGIRRIRSASGISPTIKLPVGQHRITLVVNDGTQNSEPNEVVITIIPPVQTQLRILPPIINRHSFMPRVMAWIHFPEGVSKSDIDNTWPLEIYADDEDSIEAIRQFVTQYGYPGKLRAGMIGYFNKNDLMDIVPVSGRVRLTAVGRLKSGRYFYGVDTVRILALPPRR